ncbi:DNA mismatch repair endonuclease MutL [Ferrimonas lipolytica]|uniref:DNA mismatch repair protein MutL n=1 Tax=Ferrimonas lipolytica TaxID=2724191 RepID=A0A6H1UJ43_9GAMM|nr:DNA mismatch repair endonuclease MutL [Ferrimonas lipolytica]QIZ78649.1 DNA mismatch repair endonuclease MutL [Ferrimonas lipolytica]
MAIQILPPQLANQIAAGEVVERPASVVKELVENCLDAGATKIDIEVEKGGSKALIVRDNGKGIAKSELELALARHATSKVASLADLESILSFGFRGEALASISSVSRLTLSSRQQDASEAWQAYAEGRDMAVKVQPTAHPVGTTVEVVDLFFNTPARRRFLRADKTEFTHIEEQLKRIALAKEEIHFSLRHNDKLVRQYRPARNDRQRQQRLASICGSAFADRAFMLRSSNDDLALTGFLALDDDKARVSEVQYFYVNGRVVRDKLVNHAVRQALEEAGVAQAAGFVLYLTVDPHEVDVNVHPAKHEVRFHQARYVHDFILTALQQGLSQRTSLLNDEPALTQQQPQTPSFAPQQPATGTDLHEATYSHRAQVAETNVGYGSSGGGFGASGGGSSSSRESGVGYRPAPLRPMAVKPSLDATNSYGELLQTPNLANQQVNTSSENGWQLLSQLNKTAVLFGKGEHLKLVSMQMLHQAVQKASLLQRLPQGLVGQPLLLPVSLPADVNWLQVLERHQTLLRQLGVDLSKQHQRIVLKTVPAVLRHGDLTKIMAELLQWLDGDTPTNEALANWLAQWSEPSESGAQLWLQLPQQQQDLLLTAAIELPWQSVLEQSE